MHFSASIRSRSRARVVLTSAQMQPITYSGARPELLDFFEPSGRNVLDVGCGAGGMGPRLRSAGATRVVGIEPEPSHAEAAAARGYDAVICSSIEAVLEQRSLDDERFDLILLADVLEHLVEPWDALRELVERNLSDDGQVFVSVPNVANVAVIAQLLFRRDWRYDTSGMFDRTHLRWFGADSVRSMLDQAGLTAVTWGGRVRFRVAPKLRIDRVMQNVRRVPNAAVFQFHILARRH